MADETDQTAGDRAVHRGQQSQNGILQADVGVGHRAGDGHKAAQNKEQGCADADCNHCLDAVVILHILSLLCFVR